MIPARVIGVTATHPMLMIRLLVNCAVVVTVPRSPVVMTMDVRPISSPVTMVDRAHSTAPKLDAVVQNRKRNVSIKLEPGKKEKAG